MKIFLLKDIKKNTLLFKMLSASCITSCVLILSLSLILGFYYSNHMLNLIYEMDNKILSQISYSATYIDDLVKNISYSLLHNKRIEAFSFCKDSNDMYTINSSIYKLQDICLYNPIIDSIYLYNKELDMIVSSKTGTIHNTKNFYDTQVVSLLEESSTTLTQKPIHRTLSYGESSSNVFSYFLAPNYDTSGELTSAIILNISSDHLATVINSLNTRYNKFQNDIWALDHNGKVVYTTKPGLTPTDDTLLEEVHKILSSNSSPGHYVNKINKVPYSISYIPSENLNLNFVSITPYNIVLSIISQPNEVALIFCLFFLVLGIIFSILTSKKLYRPLDTLINTVKDKVSMPHLTAIPNDITMLAESLLHSYAQIDALNLLKHSNLITLKDNLLKNYITQTASYTSKEVEKLLKVINLKIAFTDSLHAYLIKLDNYHDLKQNLGEKDISLFKYAISNIAEELTSSLYNNEVINMGQDTLLVICTNATLPPEDFIPNLIPSLKTLQSKTQEYFNLSISVSLYDHPFEISDLPTIYSKLTDMINKKIILGHQSLLYPSILPSLNQESFIFPVEKEKLLINALKVGNSSKCKAILTELFDSLSILETSYIYPSVIYISVSLYNNLNTVIESNTSNLSEDFKEFFISLLVLETLDDMKNEFYKFFDTILERMNTTKDNKSDIIITYITNIIEENYSDPALCLNSIADLLKMSPTYIGRLFKKSTLKSVSEYITQRRMEQVKYLLDTTDYSITKIVESVGLEKNNYFYTIFKKHFGISLSAYKLELQSKEQKLG